jgi:hypothetical protein
MNSLDPLSEEYIRIHSLRFLRAINRSFQGAREPSAYVPISSIMENSEENGTQSVHRPSTVWNDLPYAAHWNFFKNYLLMRFYATCGIKYLTTKLFRTREVLKFGPFSLDDKAPFELHILTSKSDVQLCLWALASWYGLGKRSDRLCIHEDGSISPQDCHVFRRMFPGCRIVTKSEADEVAAQKLNSHPRVKSYRDKFNAAMKLLDFAFFSSTKDFLLMDSDVLTLGSVEGIDGCLAGARNVFMTDIQYALTLSRSRFEELGCGQVFLPVNTGFGKVLGGTLDLDRVDFILERAPEILVSAQAEQTLYALLSAPFGVKLLGPEFNICCGFGVKNTTMKHYVTSTRRLAYVEGIPTVQAGLTLRYGTSSHWLLGHKGIKTS